MTTSTRAATAETRRPFLDFGKDRRRTPLGWDGSERRRFRPNGDLIWDWVALRQHYLRPKLHLLDLADVPHRKDHGQEPHWLEDPLTFQPLAAALRRAFDVAAALLLLAVVWPVLMAAMALVKLTSPGPVVFRQRRIGYQCRTFAMFKLRTMVDGAHRLEDRMAGACEGTFLKLRDDPRTTAVGRFLRKSSLDELPQLVNVVRGEMSLVGPRPLLLSDFDKFPKQAQMRRFSVLPGITGLWQVSGRSATTDEERIRLDLEYVERRSPWRDLVILLRTVPVALGAKGAY